MMGPKHLHELLTEDQEPFHLYSYIADRRCQLNPTAGNTALPPRRRKPVVQSAAAGTAASSFCINHVCLFTHQDSPDVRKSPLVDFPSPASKSAAVFLHVPERTAAMLLDAAIRVQKKRKPKPKPGPSNGGFGLLGSLLRRFKDRSGRAKRREIDSGGGANDCSVNGGGDCSMNLGTSCSSDEIRFLSLEKSCPSSPFRFPLQNNPSPGRRSTEFLSPATSPSCHFREEKENYETGNSQEIHVEEEEQFSPVSVLDPPFEDDDDDEEHDGRHDLECSYENIQRTKHQLLQKLLRFERLADLDPVELDKHMSECAGDDDDDGDDNKKHTEFFRDIARYLGVEKIPSQMKMLVWDLIEEEGHTNEEHEAIVISVCRRLELWETVESNTIDMMVELEFKREKSEGWRRYDEKSVRAVGKDMGVEIFGMLIEELVQELVTFST